MASAAGAACERLSWTSSCRSGDAVAHLVARFNAEGTAALTPRHGGGRRPTYGPGATARILAEAARAPFPYSAHAQAAGKAAVAEQSGQLEEAAEGYRDSAERWASFTMPIEEVHARIGHARCLIAVGRGADAAASLAAARALCERMGANSLLADVVRLEQLSAPAASAAHD